MSLTICLILWANVIDILRPDATVLASNHEHNPEH